MLINASGLNSYELAKSLGIKNIPPARFSLVITLNIMAKIHLIGLFILCQMSMA